MKRIPHSELGRPESLLSYFGSVRCYFSIGKTRIIHMWLTGWVIARRE